MWVRRAEAAAGCKRNEDEANKSGDSDGSRLWARANAQTPTVEDASAEGPMLGCGETSVCEERRAGKQSRLTIFCDATGAGSALYFRVLSGACDSDMLILRARWSEKDAGKPGLSTPADEGQDSGARCSSAGLQFLARRGGQGPRC